ncbi:sigma-70 family RNA polymerase sigma factor [uncultured Alistipes sp.]|uniref:RNA polymerase sigma factor n=1 Tax=uncultured Alistipes sp. TaxID=538949 RepID=UPI0025E718E0|nr:sigma-70 family RNA polymerase sigma factor [uncultured Alistipes sp.]
MRIHTNAPATHLTDPELLSRYRSDGRTEWLGTLYARYTELVYGIALKYLRNRPDAEDAVMQIFEELIDKASRHDIREFRTWLYTVARNHCLRQLRQSGRMPSAELPVNMADDSPVTELLCEEKRQSRISEALADCLERLPEPQRRSILLFFFENLSYADIAAATSWHLKSIKSYIQNGKRNLRNCLESNRQ